MKKLFYSALSLILLMSATVRSQTIFSEDFEGTAGTSLPAGWTQTTLATDGGWKSGTGSGLSSTYFGIPNHTKILATNDDACDCDKSADFLMSPSFDLTGYSTVYLSFDNFYFASTINPNTESAILKSSVNGGAWTTVATVPANTINGWQKQYINISTLAGQANVQLGIFYNDGGGWLFGIGIDNFTVFVPPVSDIQVVSVAPAIGSYKTFGLVNANVSLSSTLFNNSSSTVTSLPSSYTVDGNTVNQTFNVNMTPFTYTTVNFTTPYSIAAVGDHPVAIHVDVAGDVNLTDNDGATMIGGASFTPNHVLTIEEATGTWCQWCPRGAVYMDSIKGIHPTTTALVAVHNNDPMVVSAYDAGIRNYISGYPSIVTDRKETYDPSEIFSAYDDHINDFSCANLTAALSFNGTQSTVNVTANFAVNMSDVRLTCVYVEDGVHGTSSSYNQANAYSGGANQLSGAGHNWQVEPNPILAANMYYDHVARTILGGFTGQSGSLPATVTSGGTYNYTFNYTIPATSNFSNMSVFVLLINPTTGEVLNATSPKNVSGINDLQSNIEKLSVYPNPATDQLNVLLSMSKDQNVVFEISDILGRVVSTVAYPNLSSSNQLIELPVNDLSSGVYMLNIKTDGGVVSRKFVKN